MTYPFNPHQHVKIWLSKDRQSFLNLQNIQRLIQMREDNPDDTIHFVFDSHLLSEQAQSELAYFCQRYHLHPVDVRTEVIPYCKRDNEKKLIALYDNEVQSLHQGGNLAAASDILRWLPPVYQRGTYTDFDTLINTSQLPKTIPVNAPLLIHIGSIIQPNGMECVTLNTDTIAVVDEKAAAKQINQIQQTLIEAGIKQPHDLSDTFLNRTLKTMLIESEQHKIPQDTSQFSYKIIKKLAEMSAGKTMVETRQAVLDLTAGDLAPYAQADDDTPLKIRSQFLKESVVYSTGPGLLRPCLFNKQFHTPKDIDQHIAPQSFDHYKLDRAFKSENRPPLHASPALLMILLQREIGEGNDLSWLPEGEQAMLVREEELKPSLCMALAEKLSALQEHIEDNLEKNREKKYKFPADASHVKSQYAIKKTFYKRINQLFHEGYFHVDEFFKAIDQLKEGKGTEDIALKKLIDDNTKIRKQVDDLITLSQEARLFKLIDEHGRFNMATDANLSHSFTQ